MGGFRLALDSLGHRCVFASDVDEDLRGLYESNFGERPAGDLRAIDAAAIPSHDILCAGFPCQPFSKAGEQLGTRCKLWGDLFSDHVLRIIRQHRPTYLLMENVANLERHNGGRTWARMRRQLEQECGYEVDTRVLSPHRHGVPQIRERLFIVASLAGLSHFQWPEERAEAVSIHSILDRQPAEARRLPDQVVRCLNTWQEFLDRAPRTSELPSFPIWTMEFGATYPYTKYDSLCRVPLATLRNYRGSFGQTLDRWRRSDLLERVPSYARGLANVFPNWKQLFIRQDREYYERNKSWIRAWLANIRRFPPSLQKLEWNRMGEERDTWNYVMQSRTSDVRVKRSTKPRLTRHTA